MKNILYITYDGLTDPLGQSQILPYLQGLAKSGYRFTILSFEKKDRFEKEGKLIRQLTAASGIIWEPLHFTSTPPMAAKLWDALRMRFKAFSLHRQHHYNMVHCRSYIAADVGLQIKQRFGVPFFFDMRGFWADEKKDGGSWNMQNPIYREVYHYYKKKERAYLQNADYIISLTHAGKKEMLSWRSFNPKVPIQVIPCCADLEHFTLTNDQQKKEGRQKLGLPSVGLVISYLGSVGTWYMLNEMLQFFRLAKNKYPDACFLFITHTSRSIIDREIAALELDPADFIIRQANRGEVPAFVKASDINLSFIKPVYSKISSSPTKLGEVLAMGIPVICNSGIGDVAQIVSDANAGYVLHGFSDSALLAAVDAIPALLQKKPAHIRAATQHIYSLQKGIELYEMCYKAVL